MLALATLNELQRHNRDDEGDEGSPCAKRTLCSRKGRDKDVCLSRSSSWMQTDRLEPASRTRSSFQLTFASPTRIKRPQQKTQKQNKNYKLDPTDDKEDIQTHLVGYKVDRKSAFSILPIRLHKHWPKQNRTKLSKNCHPYNTKTKYFYISYI